MTITWPQALAWRLRRQLLEPRGHATVAEVVGRVGAVVAYPAPQGELAVRQRSSVVRGGDVDAALAAGEVIRAYSFRGATHVHAPDIGADYLALRGSSRMWELASWREYYRLEPADWDALRAIVREALAPGPLTRDELEAAVIATPRFAHLGFAFHANDTLLKPLMWNGDMVFGPDREGQATFQSLDAVPGWPGLPSVEDAGRRAVMHYLGAYGPVSPQQLRYWIGEGLGAGGGLRRWLAALGEEVTEVEIEGEPRVIRREDAGELAATAATDAVHLLGGRDPWLLGPGTADDHVVPRTHRALFSRGANPVIVGGRAAGTWTADGDAARIEWFDAAGPPHPAAADAAVERLAASR